MTSKCVGFNQITDLSAAVSLFDGLAGDDLAAALTADAAELSGETQSVRYTLDGTAPADGSARADGTVPTASVGMVLPAAGSGNPRPLRISGRNLVRSMLVIEGSASARLNVSFFKGV